MTNVLAAYQTAQRTNNYAGIIAHGNALVAMNHPDIVADLVARRVVEAQVSLDKIAAKAAKRAK